MNWLRDILRFFFPGRFDEMEYLPPVPVEEPSTPAPPPAPAPLPPYKPVPMPQVPATPRKMIDVFCLAKRDFEGKPGDQNYRFNNPGNYRFSSVGYLAKYGNVKKSANGFAIFPTYELGWEYDQNSVMHTAHLHPQWTILDFFQHYAPPSDNNPTTAYANAIAKKCGVPVSTTLEHLFKL